MFDEPKNAPIIFIDEIDAMTAIGAGLGGGNDSASRR
jgi:ATP-dependent Zn protease